MKIKRGVKEIVGYVHRSGDLNMAYFSVNRAQIGTDAHQRVQKNYKKEACEVFISDTIMTHEDEIEVSGRMDLLLKDGEDWTVGEIKSTSRRLSTIKHGDRPNHWAQAKFYGYLLLKQNEQLEKIKIKLIYSDLDGKKTREFDEIYTLEPLEDFVYETLDIYMKWMRKLIVAGAKKLKTAKSLAFPFGDFRAYQRELSGSVYHCIKHEKNLLLRAPTGIGKTMATIYPSIKALSHGEEKIFYFTAKTIGRTVAQKAFEICLEKGLEARVTTITAKEKICFMEEVRCDPSYCPFAKGFFDRVRGATEELFDDGYLYNRETIEAYAKKHTICPFEFSLEMATVSDGVIGDYNYLFDPRAYLRRFFEEPSPHIALIDEAHNLYDRACEMFSATLSKVTLQTTLDMYKGRSKKVIEGIEGLIDLLDGYEKKGHLDVFLPDVDYKLLNEVEKTKELLEKYLHRGYETDDRAQLINCYFELLQFFRIADYYTESFRFRLVKTEEDFQASMICLNPGIHLASRLENVKSGILFSATLHPLDYFQKILLAEDIAEQLFLPSPFKRTHLDLRVHAGLSTKYKDREKTLSAIVNRIYAMTEEKKGNYMVFCPSYAYMEQICAAYEETVGTKQEVVIQQRGMNEEDREAFLHLFGTTAHPKTLVAFAVLGGIFSEGIDLIGEALIGAVIVGVGLPQINPLMEARKQYFEKEFGEGYRYAYIVPGFNKVMQAVGRVVRTESDKGRVLLIDTRYKEPAYLELFPYEWQHASFFR